MKESGNSRGQEEEGIKGACEHAAEGKVKAVTTNPDDYGQAAEGIKSACEHAAVTVPAAPEREGKGKAVTTNPDEYGLGSNYKVTVPAPPEREGKGKAVTTKPDEYGLCSNYKVIVREDGAVDQYSFGRIIPPHIQKEPKPLDMNSGFESSGPVYQRCAWGPVPEKTSRNQEVHLQEVNKRGCDLPVTISRRVQNSRSFWKYALAMARKYSTDVRE